MDFAGCKTIILGVQLILSPPILGAKKCIRFIVMPFSLPCISSSSISRVLYNRFSFVLNETHCNILLIYMHKLLKCFKLSFQRQDYLFVFFFKFLKPDIDQFMMICNHRKNESSHFISNGEHVSNLNMARM